MSDPRHGGHAPDGHIPDGHALESHAPAIAVHGLVKSFGELEAAVVLILGLLMLGVAIWEFSSTE